jgi:hypothetical protein
MRALRRPMTRRMVDQVAAALAYSFEPKSFAIASGTECPRIVLGLVTILALKRLSWVECPAYLGELYGSGYIEVLVMITIWKDEDVCTFL